MFDSTDPLTARARFKARSGKCVVGVVAIFFGLVVVLSWISANIFSSFLPMLVGDAVALAICYFLYLAWHDRPISLQCDNEECRKLILSNTPWVCGFCKETNRNANEIPFVHKCAHCSDEAKTYR